MSKKYITFNRSKNALPNKNKMNRFGKRKTNFIT